MKKLLYAIVLLLAACPGTASAQCGAEVNDSLLANYDYVLNATNVTGTGPFTYNWTVMDGNGVPMTFTTSSSGDSIIIDANTLQNAYGCVIYQLCVNDAVGCSNCSGDTNTVEVPYNCYSQFTSEVIGSGSVAVTLNSNIPPFMIVQQFLMWTDGNGQSQGMPYFGPNTVVDYVEGPSTQGDKFFLCAMTNMVNGGCIHCDSIPFEMLGVQKLAADNIVISPNPAQEEIRVSGMNGAFDYMVQSVSGEIIFAGKCESGEGKIRLPVMPAGTYFLLLDNEQGTITKRFTKIK